MGVRPVILLCRNTLQKEMTGGNSFLFRFVRCNETHCTFLFYCKYSGIKEKGRSIMNFKKTNQYDSNFISENLMGPNSMKVLEELSQNLPLKEGMRILDLGCGTGLTSIFLAKEYGVTVYATDLWISLQKISSEFNNLNWKTKSSLSMQMLTLFPIAKNILML